MNKQHNHIVAFFSDVFLWNQKTPKEFVFLKGMMLFNLLFFCMQAGYFPYLWVSLQMIVALYFIRFLRMGGIKTLHFYPFVCCVLLLFWSLYIIFRNGFTSLQMISHLLFMPYNYVCILMPFILIPFARVELLPKILRFVVKTVKISVLFIIVFFPFMNKHWNGDMDSMGTSMQLFEVINIYLNGGLIFALLMLDLVDKKDRKFIHFACLLSLFCAAYFARRGVGLSYILAYCFYFLIKLSSQNSGKKFFTIVKSAVILAIIALFVLLYGSSLFGRLYERGTEDTRSVMELTMIEQLLETNELIQGRGYAGTYNAWEEMEYAQERDGIETGYLQLVLKGGIVYLVLVSLLFIPPVFLGFFKTKNKYTKILSLFNVLFIVAFIIANNNMTFSIRYFLFLFSMWILYNPKYRKMSNEEFQELYISGEI